MSKQTLVTLDANEATASVAYRTNEIMESYPQLLTFNVNVTKEIADHLRVSFFANNAFRAYQRAESKRVPGTFIRRGNQYFFGLELSLTL